MLRTAAVEVAKALLDSARLATMAARGGRTAPSSAEVSLLPVSCLAVSSEGQAALGCATAPQGVSAVLALR